MTFCTTVIDGAAAGLFAHHGLFIWGEWHLASPIVVLGHIALGGFVWWYPDRHNSATLQENTPVCLLFSITYLVTLFSSIIVYRLFFSPLRGFPGPKIAAATKLWHVFKVRDGTNFKFLEEMREQYGDFVRTGKL